MADILLKNFYEINTKFFDIPIYVIYNKPKDYPNHYVARLYDLDKSTSYVVIDESLESLRRKIPQNLYKQNRDKYDDEVIVESYF